MKMILLVITHHATNKVNVFEFLRLPILPGRATHGVTSLNWYSAPNVVLKFTHVAIHHMHLAAMVSFDDK